MAENRCHSRPLGAARAGRGRQDGVQYSPSSPSDGGDPVAASVGKVDETGLAPPVVLTPLEHDVDRAVVPELPLNGQEQIHARPGHDVEEPSPRSLELVRTGIRRVD